MDEIKVKYLYDDDWHSDSIAIFDTLEEAVGDAIRPDRGFVIDRPDSVYLIFDETISKQTPQAIVYMGIVYEK